MTLKTLSAAVLATMMISSPASAAGLGRLTVLSSLGQPLNAEIELTAVGKDEAGSLVAKLASTEAFRQANIDFNPALFSIRFGIEQRGGRQVIRVTSAQPINEPYIDMLLELGGANGRLVREYTFLLDPVDLRTAQVAAPVGAPVRNVEPQRPAPVQAPAALASRPASPVEAPAPAAPARAPKAKPEEVTAGGAGEKSYLVKRGDSLARIANQVRPAGVSLDQMLVALYRANPAAFVGENMNRMRTGQILTVPEKDVAGSIDNREANGVVVAQAQDFSRYRNKLAGQVAAAAPQNTGEAKQAAGGKISAKVEEQKNAASESQDKLKLSKAAAGAASASAMSAEERIAKDKALSEANSRVKDLEKNVGDLQKLLEIKNREFAEQQKRADLAAKSAAVASTAPVAPVKAPEPAPVVAKVEEKKPEPAVVVTPPVVAAAVAPKPAEVAPVVKAPAVKPPAPVAPEGNAMDELLGSPFLLPGVGLLLLGLGAFGIFNSRRKKKNQQFEDSILTDSNLKANSLFGSTGGQSVDTNNSVFNSNFAPSASQLDANEVDPVAEADVYIAYGRDAQAEEILKEALRTQPERNAVRVKLLEIYSNRRDVRSFEVMATELYGITKGEGDDWEQAASLGIALDPDNPLYAGGRSLESAVTQLADPAAANDLADELDLEALLASTQSNIAGASLNTIPGEMDINTASYLEPEPKAPAAEVKPVVEEKENDGLDFDLEGLGIMDVESSEVLVDPARLTSDEHNKFSLDFDAPDAVTGPKIPVAPEVVEFNETTPVAPVMSASPEPLAEDMTFELPGDDALGEEIAHDTTPNAASKPDPLDFDLSGISLDLMPNDAAAVTPPQAPFLAAEPADTLVLEDDEIATAPEMATKLDLAIAYEEIGDKEGARELLDEVIAGGSSQQIEQARSMLAKLG
ncbi:FimV/HubP family polar landmark protein [Actimicrobium sp. GrIS 1.19]|uniref:FimV/HubP family polar landmark protein n=1 Tax=Actimicrobium sp. GrIS 1.19 TaxID=3071708 RepID=UPI002E1397D8